MNPAKSLALRLAEHTPLLWGTDPLAAAVAAHARAGAGHARRAGRARRRPRPPGPPRAACCGRWPPAPSRHLPRPVRRRRRRRRPGAAAAAGAAGHRRGGPGAGDAAHTGRELAAPDVLHPVDEVARGTRRRRCCAPRCSPPGSTWPRCTSGWPPARSRRPEPANEYRRALAPWSCWTTRSAPTRGVRAPLSPSCSASRCPSPHPQAEMWLGAHPGDPSRLPPAAADARSTPCATTRTGMLGADRARRWDATLPFLLKVLAADEPLSLQAHPSLEQARDGFAAGGRGRASRRDAADRNYRDANHKPELICALTEFHALVGFREPADHRRAAARAGRARSSPSTPSCWPPSPTPTGCARCSPPGSRCRRRCSTRWCPPCRPAASGWPASTGRSGTEARTALELSERYPGDAGVLAALLLNRVTLRARRGAVPARRQPARLPVQGAGIELMANSDNVLRGGLTPKHVDVPELLRVLDFAAAPPPVLTGTPERRLAALRHPVRGVPAAPLREPGPAAATRRGARRRPADPALHGGRGAPARSAAGELELARGASVWLGAEDTDVTVAGAGRRAPSCSSPATRWTSDTAGGPIRANGRVSAVAEWSARDRPRECACQQVVEPGRSSRRCSPTPVSRSRSSSAT